MEKRNRLTLAVVVVMSLLSIALIFLAMKNTPSFSIPSIRIELGDTFREWDRKHRMENQESVRESTATTKQVTNWPRYDWEEIDAILATCQKDADGIRSATCFGRSGEKPTCSCMKTS